MIGPGDELGGYEIIEKLGEGGMGVVFLAREPRLGRRVALKLIAPNLSSDPEFARRFEDEARSAAAIEHPNAVPIYTAGEDDGHLYLAMRFIDGTDVRAMLRSKGPVAPEIAALIVAEVGGALDAAHSLGLVHRDVKPANILVGGHEPMRAAYLTDFGLTKGLEESRAGLTGTGHWVGTIDYVAPEQMHGNRIDARTDVYALGCVLYELLTGAVPFGGSDVQKMWAHTNEQVPPLEMADRDLADRLDLVIARATAKDPDDRYPSAGDLGRAALSAVEGRAVAQSERSVATGAAAVGLTQGAEPTRSAPRPRPAPVAEPETRRLRQEPYPGTAVRTEDARESKASGGRAAVWIGAALVVAAGIVAGAVVLSGGSGGSTSTTRTVVQQQSAKEPAQNKVAQKQAPASNATSGETLPALTQAVDLGCACSMLQPDQADWSGPVHGKPYPRVYRTTFSGPSGEQLLVDWTPADEPTFGGAAESSQTLSHPQFGDVTEYTIGPGAVELVPCQVTPCTNIVVPLTPDSGWAVVAGGFEDPAVSEDLARQVALSLQYAPD